MSRKLRLGVYGALAMALVAVMVLSPQAWATPEQSRPGQGPTVPTRTPKPSPWPTDAPLPTEAPGPQPGPTAIPGPADTPPPASVPALTPGPTGLPLPTSASLRLTKQVDRRQVWPGLTVRYTLTLSNVGTGPASQVTIRDTLPKGLEPGAISGGAGATWEGQTLKASALLLPAGAQLVMSYTATVRRDATPGQVLINRATALAEGGLQASAEAYIVLPPAELPPTGERVER